MCVLRTSLAACIAFQPCLFPAARAWGQRAVSSPARASAAPALVPALGANPAGVLPGTRLDLGLVSPTQLPSISDYETAASAPAAFSVAERALVVGTQRDSPEVSSIARKLTSFSPRIGEDAPAQASSKESARSRLEASRGSGAAGQVPGFWTRYWHGTRLTSQGDVAAPVSVKVSAGAARIPLSREAKEGRGEIKGKLEKTLPNPLPRGERARGSSPLFRGLLPILSSRLEQGLPYIWAGAVLGGTLAVHHVLNKGLKALWRWRGWDQNSLLQTRVIAGIALWSIGISVAMSVGDIEWFGVLTTLGLPGLATGLFMRDFLGNMIHRLIFLLKHPFQVGEKVNMDETEFTLEDMGIRYLTLRKPDGKEEYKTYAQIMNKAVTRFKPYTLNPLALKPIEFERSETGAVQEPSSPRPSRLHSIPGHALRLAGVLAIAAAGSLLPETLAFLGPYILGVGVLLLTWFLERLVLGWLTRLARKRNWGLHFSALVRLATSSAMYFLGGISALGLAGFDWQTFAVSTLVISASVGLAAYDFISSAVQLANLLSFTPFRIGDTIEVSSRKGQVVDMNFFYIVLNEGTPEAPKTHLLPYSLFAGSGIIIHARAALPEKP